MRTSHVRLTALLLALALLGAAAGAAWLASGGREAERSKSDATPGTTPGTQVDVKTGLDTGPKTGAAVEEIDGSAVFARHCIRCHATDDLRAPLEGADRTTALRDLVEYLRDHGDADEAQDRAIAAYLLETER